MKLQTNQVIKTLDGEPVKTKIKDNEVDLTVKHAITESLLANYPDERELSNTEKMTRWVLAKKVHSAKDVVELTVEDATKIKDMVLKGFGVLVGGVVADLIEK